MHSRSIVNVTHVDSNCSNGPHIGLPGGSKYDSACAAFASPVWVNGRKPTNILAPVYGRFTECFNTPDLKDAKALLEELK
jgi:hypothetical protein